MKITRRQRSARVIKLTANGIVDLLNPVVHVLQLWCGCTSNAFRRVGGGGTVSLGRTYSVLSWPTDIPHASGHACVCTCLYALCPRSL